MSTRAQVMVSGNDVKIYKHSDGYPSNVMPILQKLLPAFKEGRGFDDQYLPAHLCNTFVQKTKDGWKNRAKRRPDLYPKEKVNTYSFLGHGLTTRFHYDIAYFYFINNDFGVDIYRPAGEYWDEPNMKNLKLFKRYTLDELVCSRIFKDN